MSPSRDQPSISIAPDRLSARLRLPANTGLDLVLARELLANTGLKHGIDPQVLRNAGAIVPEAQDLLLATGEAAPDLSGCTFELKVPLGTWVVAGQALGRVAMEGGPVAGRGVDGLVIPPIPPRKVGVGLALAEDGAVTARRAGVVRRDSQAVITVAVEGGSNESAVESPQVQLAPDGVDASLVLLGWQYVQAHVLHQALVALGIVHGLQPAALEEATLGAPGVRRLVLARGLAPVHGQDGRLDMQIDERVHLKVDAQGRVDYHEHGRIEDVVASAPLARILPPTEGTPGIDVHGRPMTAKPGRVLDPARVMGEGVGLHPEQPDLIHTLAAGHFHRDRQGRLCVENRLVVEGDVDFRHGNITTTLSVLVKGDIKAGFSVKSSGDIEVMGVVEDARVSAQGNLVVRGGILPGSQRIKAHGDIDARYVSNREVKCRSLRITGSLRWSQVLATGDVIAKEILGGNLIAGGNVASDQIGSSDGIATRVQVGTDPYEERLYLTAREEHDRLTQNVCEGKQRCKVIAHGLAGDPSRGDELRTALAAFSEACTRLATCEAILERHVLQQDTRKEITAAITVSGTAYRGVEILFDEVARMVLDQDLAHPNFRLDEGAIVW
jgi:uncharacterized protein (DUF342 family)